MRDVTIARNYAETLFELGGQKDAVQQYGDVLDATAAAFSAPSVEAMLMSPRVTKAQKAQIVAKALEGAPTPFVQFVVAVIKRGRQLLIPRIADEYRALLDARLGRVRASITLASDADPLTRQVISERLAKAIGKDVIAAFTTDPSILGGTVVRIGDQVYDGSVRKRLGRLRRQLLS